MKATVKFVALALVIVCAAAQEPPTSWPQFTAVAQVDTNSRNYFINAPLRSVGLISAFLDLAAENTPAAKDASNRQCDIVVAVATDLTLNKTNGTVLVVTNQTQRVRNRRRQRIRALCR